MWCAPRPTARSEPKRSGMQPKRKWPDSAAVFVAAADGEAVYRRRGIVNEKRRWVGLTAAIATLVLALGLAACGGDDDGVGGASDREVPVAQGGEATGDVLISNWPGYIDKGSGNTLDEFE